MSNCSLQNSTRTHTSAVSKQSSYIRRYNAIDTYDILYMRTVFMEQQHNTYIFVTRMKTAANVSINANSIN